MFPSGGGELLSKRVPPPKPNKSGCLIWQGYKNWFGYGAVKIGGRVWPAHRYYYHKAHPLEEIKGMVVMHICDVRGCVNPQHLRLGTQTQNLRDMHTKGRQGGAPGIKNFNAKLTEAQVHEIRSLRGTASQSEVARRYNVSQVTISYIWIGKTWKSLPRLKGG